MAKLKHIYKSSLKIVPNTFILLPVTLTIVRKAFRRVKHHALTEFVLRIIFLTFSETLVRKEILKARKQSRETLLDKEKMSRNDDRVTFNITYYLVSKNIKNFIEELHILLAPDEQHRNGFTDIPRIGFKNCKKLKDHLYLRSVLPNTDVAGNPGPCGGKRSPCELGKLMKKVVS